MKEKDVFQNKIAAALVSAVSSGCLSRMDNYLVAATFQMDRLQMTNAHGAPLPRVQPVFSAVSLSPLLGVAASTRRATVVFTNLPGIAASLGLIAAASAAEEHLFPPAGANIITALGGST